MAITNDAREYVFGVFQADGYECKFLLAILRRQQEAIALAHKLRADDYYRSENLSVEQIEVGKQIDPCEDTAVLFLEKHRD